MSFSDDQIEALQIIASIFSTLSVITSLFMVLTHAVFEKRRQQLLSRTLGWLALCALCHAISFWMIALGTSQAIIDNEPACVIQGIIQQYFGVAVYCWFFVLALILYLTVVRNVSILMLEQYERHAHFVVWIPSGILTLIPGAANVYGPAGFWCWITKVNYQIGCFYAILLALLLYGAVIIGLVGRKLFKKVKFSSINFHEEGTIGGGSYAPKYTAQMRLTVFLILFVIAWSLNCADRMYEFVSSKSNFTLKVLHTMLEGGQGFWVATSLGFTRGTYLQWKSFCVRKKNWLLQHIFK